jgi:hypothetical protein
MMILEDEASGAVLIVALVEVVAVMVAVMMIAMMIVMVAVVMEARMKGVLREMVEVAAERLVECWKFEEDQTLF